MTEFVAAVPTLQAAQDYVREIEWKWGQEGPRISPIPSLISVAICKAGTSKPRATSGPFGCGGTPMVRSKSTASANPIINKHP